MLKVFVFIELLRFSSPTMYSMCIGSLLEERARKMCDPAGLNIFFYNELHNLK